MGPEQFTVDTAATGQRLDVFVAGCCAGAKAVIPMSRAGVRKLIDAGHITVNGERAKASLRVKARDNVVIHMPEIRDVGLIGEALPLFILYEDEDVLVVNKAAGMVVHPAAGCASGTLVNAVLHHCPAIAGIGGDRRPGIVHRLDKGTSGVMVVAKNDLSMRLLMDQFKSRTVHKEYLALVHGSMAGEWGEIDRAIGRHRTDRKRMSSLRVNGKSRQAKTPWAVEERYAIAMTARALDCYCLIRLAPRTGRTHQIRVHLADAGHPLVGDRVYGRQHSVATLQDKIGDRVTGFPRHALHAEKLIFNNVRSGVPMCFSAPLPDDMSRLIDDLRKHAIPRERFRAKSSVHAGLTRLEV